MKTFHPEYSSFLPPLPPAATPGQRRAPAGSSQPGPDARGQVGSHLMRFCRPCLLEFLLRIALVMVATAERRAGSRLPPPSPAPQAAACPPGAARSRVPPLRLQEVLQLVSFCFCEPPLLHTPGLSPPPLPPPPPPPRRGSVTGESLGAQPAAGPAAQSQALLDP